MKALPKTKKSKNGGKNNSGEHSIPESKSSRVKRVRPLKPKQFVDIIEHMNDGLVVLDKDWHYVYVNQKAAVMLQQQKPSDLIGKHIWTEFPEGVGQPFQLAYEKAMREQTPIVFEEHYEPWDLWFENRIYPSPDSLMILFTEITERKRAEAALQRDAELIRDLYNNAPCGYHSLNKDGVFIEINDTELGWLGLRREEVIGKMRLEDFLTAEGRKSFQENFPRFKEHGAIRDAEFQLVCRDGTLRTVLLSSTAVKDEAGNYLMSRSTLYDITERKRAEEQVNLLQTITMEVAEAGDLSSALEVVLRRVCEQTGWVYGQVWLPREDGSVLDCGPAWFSDAGLEEFRAISAKFTFPPGKGLPGRVWSSKQPVWLENATLDPKFPRAEAAMESGLRAALAVPILADDEIVAVIEFFLHEQRTEDTRLLKVIAAVAAQLGLVLERKRVEDSLRESEQRFQLASRATQDVIFDWDIRSGFLWWNESVSQTVYGYAPEDVRHEITWWEGLVHPEDRDRVINRINSAAEGTGQILEGEYRLRRADGSYAYVYDRGFVMRDENGKPVRLVGSVMDITERKRMEGLLEERQHLLQKILDTEPGTVYVYDLEERRNVYVNRHWLSAFGYTAEETQAMGDELLVRIFHPDDLTRISDHHENWRQANDGDIREIEYRVRTKAGEWRWLHSHEAAFAHDESGRVRQILGISYEITSRKLAQEALWRSEQQLGLIYDSVSDIIFLLSIEPDDRYRFVSANKPFFQATGLRSDQVIDQYIDEIIHPSSHQLVFGNYKRAIQERVPVTWEEVAEYPAGQKTAIVTINTVYNEEDICTHLVGTIHDITERKQAEKALRESEEKFSKVFHASPVALSIRRVSDGRYVEVNESFLKRMEYQREEIIGRTALEINAWANPSEREKMLNTLHEQGSLRDFEAQFRTKSGEIGTALLFRDVIEIAGEKYFIGTTLDITERKEMEKTVLKERDFSDAMLNSLPGILYFYDQTGKFLRWNRNLEIVTGYSGKEIARMNPLDFFVGVEKEYIAQRIQEVFRNGESDAEANLVSKNGNRIPYYFTGKRIEIENVPYLIGMGIDITQRRQAEEELRKLNLELEGRIAARTEELAAAMIKAQESDRLKSAFLATMSHELRTPLNSIIGFTGVILRGLAGPLNEEQNKQLNMIYDSAHHLLALINDVLDISKIEAGQLEIFKRSFDMRQAIESVLRIVQPLAHKKNLQLVTSIGSGVGIINNDRRRVEQVLINLVNNAIKFSERGEVSIECQIKDGWLETSVHDSGIGIKPEDMDRLFKPFQQIDTGLARGHEGTGLGLAICKRLVTVMGGEINVESQWGVGSTFKFTLPI
jgi:PAS domain S-box-containing protein